MLLWGEIKMKKERKSYDVQFRCFNCRHNFTLDVDYGYEVRFYVWKWCWVIVPTGNRLLHLTLLELDACEVECERCGSLRLDKR